MTFAGPSGAADRRYEKIHPFSIGGETKAFDPGALLQLARIGAEPAALCLCPLVCYDLRFPELWRLAALEGAEVFLLSANWPAARQHHWRSLCIARAIENQAFVVAVNRVGSDPAARYEGGSLIISPRGDVIAEAGREPEALQAALDGAELRRWRRDFPALQDLRREHLGQVEVVRESLPAAQQRVGR
jgi:predicted amidohydrolase